MTVAGRDPLRSDAGRKETYSLIASDKVEGTSVYGLDREKIGKIDNVMIEKKSGKVSYAVLSFGGFLGMGTDYYPAPWNTLKYEEDLGGYLINLTADQINGAPKYANEESWDWANAADRETVDAYYRPMTTY